jgi:hypothetical protein
MSFAGHYGAMVGPVFRVLGGDVPYWVLFRDTTPAPWWETARSASKNLMLCVYLLSTTLQRRLCE